MMFLQIAVDAAAQDGVPQTLLSGLINKLGDRYFRRLVIDLAAIIILLWGIYLPNNNKNREYLFTFMMLNVVIFHLSYLLSGAEFSTGVALGLFAVFGLLRYRTEDIPMKDMTYVFLSISMGLITGVMIGDWEPAVVCAIVLVITFIMDARFILKKELSKSIQYENIEMIKPENHAKLLADLRERTGLDIHYIRIRNVDYLRDTATIRIYYFEHADNAQVQP